MNTVYQEVQQQPTKRITTRRETPSPSPRHQQHVMAPARLATRQALAVGVFGGLALSSLLTLAGRRFGVGLEPVDYALLFVCLVSLGLMLGAWWGRATLAEMIATFEPMELEETQTEETQPPRVSIDAIPVTTNGGSTRYVSRPVSVRVGGQTLTINQIHALRTRAQQDGTITRETTGLSGQAYQALTEALKASERIEDFGRGYRWTARGMEWLGAALPQDVSGENASSPLDRSDRRPNDGGFDD